MLPSSNTPFSLPSGPRGGPLLTSRWSKIRAHQAVDRYAALSFVSSLCAAAAPLWPYSDSYARLAVDLAGHFVWPNLAVAGGIAFVSTRKARWVALASALVCAGLLANAYRASETPVTASIAAKGLPVMSVNVLYRNPSPDKLLQLLAKEQPAVVFVQEVSPAWAEVLDKLQAYPYRKIVPRKDPFGVALLSIHPLEDVTVAEEGARDVPSISATMDWNGTKVELRAVHPRPPFSPGNYVERNRMLADHAAALVATGRPALLAGDFNATPWSAGVSVVQNAGLVRATSLVPTWPAHAVVPAVIPIDYITASKHWGVLSNGRGPDVGSDHYPVMATVFLK